MPGIRDERRVYATPPGAGALSQIELLRDKDFADYSDGEWRSPAS